MTSKQDNQIKLPPELKRMKVGEINLEDKIFDSLKEEYEEFSKWFKKIVRENRECWVSYWPNKSLASILIYKKENEPIKCKNSWLPSKPRLKISTFKVDKKGQKLGELHIKLIVMYAIENNLEEIYLTHFKREEKDYLVELITEYGFKEKCQNPRGEFIYIKNLKPTIDKIKKLKPTEICKKYWPMLYDGPEVKKFIIPIQPKYHKRLFPEYNEKLLSRDKNKQRKLTEFIDILKTMKTRTEGNTIKKAYLCHSNTRKMKEGNIVLFYRSKDKFLTTIGVIDKIFFNCKDVNQIEEIVKKRTVYSHQEIKEMTRQPITIILFVWNFHMKKPISLKSLKELGVLKAQPQSITEITHENYIKIKKEGKFDGRFSFN